MQFVTPRRHSGPRRFFVSRKPILLTAALLAACFAGGCAGEPEGDPGPKAGNPQVGDAAPDLKLANMNGGAARDLVSLRGQPVVLLFGSCT